MDHLTEETLNDLRERRLAPAAASDVEQHLKGCPDCSVVLARLATVEKPAAADPLGALGDLPVHRNAPTLAQRGVRGEEPTPPEGTLPTGRPAELPLARGASVGRFTILKPLGEGGMGIVYAAYDPELDRRVALKLLHTTSRTGAEASERRNRLLREAQAMARLSHPNVIPVFDVGTFGQQVFVAMEFVDGATLTDWLEREPRSWRQILDVFLQAGRGLAAAHKADLIHRDFKSDNVLVGNDGRVRVVDFGVARLASQPESPQEKRPLEAEVEALIGTDSFGPLTFDLTRTGTLVGSPAYMSPEQMRGERTDARADIFSFCVALYEALYEDRPFAGETVKDLRASVLGGKVKDEPEGTHVPHWLRKILLRGLQVDAQARFPSMDALLEELARDPNARRRRTLLALGGVVLAVAAILGYRQVLVSQSLVCKGAERKLDGVWDPARRDAVHRAFAASGKGYAEAVFATAAGTLDDYASRWAAMHTEACEATRLRGEQSEELLDLRMQCLGQRRQDLVALAQVFAEASPKAIDNAVEAAQGLPALETCANVRGLRGELRPPPSPDLQANVQAIQSKIAQAKALRFAERNTQALALLEEATAEAHALDHKPLEAEALVRLGGQKVEMGDLAGAESTLHRAAQVADEGHAMESLLKAWTQQVFVIGYRRARHDEGRLWADYAAATLKQMSAADHALAASRSIDLPQADLEYFLGAILEEEGRHEGALAIQRHSLELYQRHLPPTDLNVLRAEESISGTLSEEGKLDEAVMLQERSLAAREKAMGADHPRLALDVTNLGLLYFKQNRFQEAVKAHERALRLFEKTEGADLSRKAFTLGCLGDAYAGLKQPREALAAHREALEIYERTLGQDHPDVAEALTNVGEDLLALGQPKEAQRELERSLALREARKDIDPVDLADTRFALAKVLVAQGKEPKRARKLGADAHAAYAGVAQRFPSSRAAVDAAKVEEWLAQH